MSTPFDKLNRLRVNAGKNPLKSWKASQDALQAQIVKFEADGFTDALPGADVERKPETTDPEIAAVLDSEPPKPLADSAMAKMIDNSDKPSARTEPSKTQGKASLARGLDTDSYARHSRERVRDNREAERKEKKNKPKVELTEADKKQIKDEAESRDKKKVKPAKVNPTGAVDPKTDPDKAKRQLKHIEEKQAARAAKPSKTPAKEKNDNEITVAEIARELDIDPKVARAKLRRHEEKLSKLHTKGQDRWVFPKSAKDEIVKILK